MGGQAQTRSVEDPVYAEELLASIGELPAPDPADPDAAAKAAVADQLRRVRALQALVEGKPAGELPPGSEELAALIKGAPLWRNEVRTPPAGLITSLQRLANPSSLSQSLLALALWRSGDVDGSRALLRTILDRVADQPAARTMMEALDRQDMLAENGDPELAVPPSDPESEPEMPPEPADPTAGGETPTPTTPAIPGDGKTGPVRTTPGVAQERVEVLISTGCQKVRQGDPMGVKLLLDAVDRGADPMQNFNLCFCLGAGFARQNSHDAALTWYARAVRQSPQNRDAIAGAARSAELLGRTGSAVDYYKKLRALDPGNAAAAAYLSKHDQSHEPPPPSDDPPGELMPIKPKQR
jgi:tetratricopeptide (TPR) repeat protein